MSGRPEPGPVSSWQAAADILAERDPVMHRLVAALGGEVTPERMLALPDGTLRSVGLSGSKAATVQDLAAKVLDGTVVLDPPGLRAESDPEVVARLTTVRGIGK